MTVRTGTISWFDLQDGQPENSAVDFCVGQDCSYGRQSPRRDLSCVRVDLSCAQ